jgi:uncharacterized protein YlxP (DUF503 family)
MRIGAALIELHLPVSASIKARRRAARAIADRVRQRFNVSVADLGDQDDRHRITLGCVTVGVDPRHVRSGLEKIVSYVESLGLAELVGDDLVVACLDELEPDETDDSFAPQEWLDVDEPGS